MACKKCPICGSKATKKNGKRAGIQRYFCQSCRQSFSSRRRPSRLRKRLFTAYFYEHQTLKALSRTYHKDREWIQRQIHSYEPPKTSPHPRPVTLVIDATFFGKRGEGFGVLVAKDILSGQLVAYRFIQTETLNEYAMLRQSLLDQGFIIQAVTVDGRRGLFGLFADLPVQMCHFHQQAILTRYLTRRPTYQASRDLKRIASYLGQTTPCRFRYMLEAWLQRHKDFYEEKTPDDSPRGWHYTHDRPRSAYRSLERNLPYLFTHKTHPHLGIANTTNTLDGGLFSPMKALLKIHRGIGDSMKKKLITDFLEKAMK
ncbi:hypothetical protein Nitsa_0013 [Nitratifractor salsuginis DSM 16511]|uniref:Transposase n=1 Tax=Nitratifractor salsuginis (strain DSM 16511 / JCM 12458 / E9I37-1) TaxID=749222 RepID=E6WXW6_NITSE|nr:hypothetical protein Nitsa_0013 [Nitratifractor salsuginis DSM 16511]